MLTALILGCVFFPIHHQAAVQYSTQTRCIMSEHGVKLSSNSSGAGLSVWKQNARLEPFFRMGTNAGTEQRHRDTTPRAARTVGARRRNIEYRNTAPREIRIMGARGRNIEPFHHPAPTNC